MGRRRHGVIGRTVEPHRRRGVRWFLVRTFTVPAVFLGWAVGLALTVKMCGGG